jgi:Cu2+-exporting ATPase
MPGVKRADVNFVSGSATLEYDESMTDIERITRCVRDCGYHCTGEMLPSRICAPDDPPADARVAAVNAAAGPMNPPHDARHGQHGNQDGYVQAGTAMAAKPGARAGHVMHPHAGHADSATAPARPPLTDRALATAQPAAQADHAAHVTRVAQMDAMAHEMGHGAGMDMAEMAPTRPAR